MENDYYKYRFYKHLLNVEATADGGILFQTDTDMQNLPLLLDAHFLEQGQARGVGQARFAAFGQMRGRMTVRRAAVCPADAGKPEHDPCRVPGLDRRRPADGGGGWRGAL